VLLPIEPKEIEIGDTKGVNFFDLPDFSETSKLKILLVMSLANQKMIAEILSKRGHKVDVAIDGVESIDEFHKNKNQYNVLLLDEEISEIKCSQVVEKIREYERQNCKGHTLIIFISNQISEQQKIKMSAIGIDIYLTKPFQVQQLIKAIEDYD